MKLFDPDNLDMDVDEFTGMWKSLVAHANRLVARVNALARRLRKLEKSAKAGVLSEYVVVGLDVNGVPGTYRSAGKDFEQL